MYYVIGLVKYILNTGHGLQQFLNRIIISTCSVKSTCRENSFCYFLPTTDIVKRLFKMITLLMLRAIELNQKIQNTLFPYRYPLYWNFSTKQLVGRTGKSVKRIPWFIIMFILMPWSGGISSIIVLHYWLAGHYRNINILQIFILVLQCTATIIVFWVVLVLRQNSKSWFSVINILVKLRSTRSANRNTTSSKSHNVFKYAFIDNGRTIDYYGILLILITLGFSASYFTVIPFAFFLEVDAPFHLFQILFSRSNTLLNVLMQFTRIFIGTLSCAEGLTVIRVCILNWFILLRHLYISLKSIRSKIVSRQAIIEYQSLKILLLQIKETLSIVVPLKLTLLYVVLLSVFSVSVIGLHIVSWYFYIGLTWIGILTFVLTLFGWYLVVKINEFSKQIKEKWSTDEVARNVELLKMTNSLEPISIDYVSAGKLNKKARAEFLFRLLTDFMNLTLIIKEYSIV